MRHNLNFILTISPTPFKMAKERLGFTKKCISLFTNELRLILYVCRSFYFFFCDTIVYIFSNKFFAFFPLIYNSLCVKYTNSLLIKCG